MKKMGFEASRSTAGMSYHVLPLKTIDIETVEKRKPVVEDDRPF